MIERTSFNPLKEHLKQKEISLIVGPRQAGKTTIMLLLKEHLEKKGEKTLFFNLDIERDRQFFVSQDALVRRIELEFGRKKGHVFIDEVQRRENAGLFLKGLYDMGLPCKFIVSGSGSLELKEKIHESLVGRKRVFELSTLSFEEFANYRTAYRYKERLDSLFEIDRLQAGSLLDEYMSFGGYPRVVLSSTTEEKGRVMDEVYQSYIEKDISYLLGVEKTGDFSQLAKTMAFQAGNPVNISEVSSTLGISLPTVKKYLWYMQNTFVISRVTPYFANIRKEITKRPVYYFNDIGLRNYALADFGIPAERERGGYLFENCVFNLLKEKVLHTPSRIHFWRTKDGAEVDFVMARGKEALPIEAKYSRLKETSITRSLKSYISKYHPSRALVVNLSLDKTVKFGGTEIHFLPFYKLGGYLDSLPKRGLI